MSKKQLINITCSFLILAIIAVLFLLVQSFCRDLALRAAADYLSSTFFADAEYELDMERRSVSFPAGKSALLKKYHIDGRSVFTFPVKFFELPWYAHLKKIEIYDVKWSVDLAENKVNNEKYEHFISAVGAEIDNFAIPEKDKTLFPDIVTYGNMELTNPEGKKRVLPVRSILKKHLDQYLLGVYAGEMKINFLYNGSDKKLIGQYQAQQSDFEFFRLSFGLPELFNMTGAGTLSGQFQYDGEKRKLDYIRGGSRFGIDSSIQGSIFSIYGSNRGRINWEYLNPQNWQIEFRNATSGKPFHAKLHYFVLSQNTMEQNAVNFDGEIEFNPMTFKELFNLELDSRTAGIRHRLVGKWDMLEKSWELSRLDTQKRVPQVKLKWNDIAISFQGQSFKIYGRGAQADHFGFRYELEMGNVDLKDNRKNVIIGSGVKMEGDCILSLADDTLKPVSSGRISCEVADGAVDNTRFLLKNIKLSFAPDGEMRNKYAFYVGDVKLGIPDFRQGINVETSYLDGRISRDEISVGSPFLHFKYADKIDVRSDRRWSFSRRDPSAPVLLKISSVAGKFGAENFNAEKIDAVYEQSRLVNTLDGAIHNVRIGKNIFSAAEIGCMLEFVFPENELVRFNRIEIQPRVWKYKNKFMSSQAPSSKINFVYNGGKLPERIVVSPGQAVIESGGREYILPDMQLTEINRGEYSDGMIKCDGSPYKFDFSYTRRNREKKISLKSGRIDGSEKNIWGLQGDVSFFENGSIMNAVLAYAEARRNDLTWENGKLDFSVSPENGVSLNRFEGTVASDMTKVVFKKLNSAGDLEFEVKNLPVKYAEHTLGVPEGTFNGMFDGKIVCRKEDFYNPFKIQTFYLTNNRIMRMQLGVLESCAQRGKSVEDDFGADALKDFFAKTLLLEYQKVKHGYELSVKALGKSSRLLPYEFDVREKKLKKTRVALFNSEVEVIMKYLIKKP